MNRARCAPPAGTGAPGDDDPRCLAHRWAETAERVRARKVPGVDGLVAPAVWAAAADPDTWTPAPTRDETVAGARVLGGWSSGFSPGAGDPFTGWEIGPFVGALAVWQRDLLVCSLGLAGLSDGLLAGVPPGWGSHPVDSALGGVVGERGLRLGTVGYLDGMGGAVPELLRDITGPIRGAPHLPALRTLRAVQCLLDGTGGTRPGPACTVTVHPPGWRTPVEVRAVDLHTTDPRPARRFLQVFDWRPRYVGGGGDTPVGAAVTGWLCATAPSDRGAAVVLAHHGLRGGGGGTDVLLALRVAGIPVEPPAGNGRTVEPRAAPALWWRRLIRRVTAHPDRLRAVEDAEAAWVRLAAGA